MFTLKLFRVVNCQLVTSILTVDHVRTMAIGPSDEALEIWAFDGPEPSDYKAYFVGKREPDMTAGPDDIWWGWGLLENAAGKTTQHFRPHSYGI